jgi:hypothetical protein
VLGQIPLLKQWMEKVWTESLYIETCLYFGVVAVVLAILALLKRRREVWLWLIVMLVGVVLALGPVLKVGGQQFSGIPLPYTLVNRLPFYEWVRTPARMDMMIKLALAMLAALGAGVLVRRVSPRGKVIVSGALCGLMLFEYLTFAPYPMAKVYPSDFLSGLAGDGQDYGILHIASHEYSMYLQTLHGHRMVEGHIHRWPPGGSEWALQLHGLALFPPEAEQPYYDILDKKLPYGRDGGDIFAGTLDLSPANILARLGIRYVVFERKSPWTKHDGDVYLARLEAYFGRPIHEDKRLNIYEVRKRPAEGPELTPGEGWYRLEGAEHETWRWMKERAAVSISGLPGSQAYRLKLTVRPRQAPQNLTVAVDEKVLGEYRLTGQREIVTPPFTPGNTSAALHLSTPEGCGQPWNVLQGNLDSRCLGLAFDEVRLFPALREPRRFGEQLELVGYELTRGSGLDRSLYLGLYWQAVGRMARDYTVFVHAVDERGQTVVQDDQQLRTRRGSPTSAWGDAEGVRSLHQLDLPAEAETGTLRLKVGLYDVESMERLPLAGDQSGENAVTITGSGEAQ